MERLANYRYQTIRDWEGKIKKISQKEYTSSIGHGQYYPGEGALAFQEKSGDVIYFLGGARHTKPAHWSMSDIMFKVKLKELSDGSNYTLDSFDIINPSMSETSEPPKLVFSAGLTIQAKKSKMVGFSVNGKSLQLRDVDMALTNEINLYETVGPKHTTYRIRTIRTPDRAQTVKVISKSAEILQQGNIPPSMYASTLTLVKKDGALAGEAVLVGGNCLVQERATPIQIMLGMKSIWEEQSSGNVFVLKFNLDIHSFEWEKKQVEVLPRAHHSSMVADNKLYVFGGVNYVTKVRYDIRPVIIDIVNWVLLAAIIPESFPDISLSGHSFCQVTEHECIFIGGYNQLKGDKTNEACDKMIKMVVKEEEVVSLEVKSLCCGPIAQASLIQTPKENVFVVAGGIQERWALLSENIAPSAPCSLEKQNKCILVKTPENYLEDTVNWLACDGPCARWFHVPCVHLTHEDFVRISKQKKWYCKRSDCK